MIKHVVFAVVLFLGAFSLQAGEIININSADAVTIEQELKGVGKVKAQAIVKYRKENGPFKSVDELVNVTGIGEKTLEKMRGKISVSSKN